MCGIAGFYGFLTPDERKIAHCLSLMRRRGPDANGVYRYQTPSGESICLLHSRLGIIDLDPRSNQPMERAGKIMALNGELYNYRELKSTAEKFGALSTNGDTEIFLYLFAGLGVASLDMCEGMWAFAYFDEATGALKLCRDRFGEKPLYLYQNANGLYFASEIKFIMALLGEQLPVNKVQLLRYMVNGYRALYKSGETFFQDIKELPAGTIMEISPGRIGKPSKYWHPEIKIDPYMSFDDAVQGARLALMDAVRIRLRADVPLAFCMSGGIDSNGLISIARNHFGFEVHGFTIVNQHARYAEQDMVDIAVREQGLRHSAIHLDTKDFLPKLKQLVEYHDAPVYTVSAYTHWLLMEAIAESGFKVVISGTGADELFSGYYDHHLYYLAEIRGSVPDAFFNESVAAWHKYIEPITLNPILKDPSHFEAYPEDRRHLYMNADMHAAYLREEWSESFVENDYGSGFLRNRMLNELFVETIPPPMHEEDLNAMYYSLENRSPYLDRRLFEYCNTIPTHHLIQHGAAKAVLREALRGLVPNAILNNRRKMGFNAPLLDLLDMSDPSVRDYLLAESPFFDLVDRNAMIAMLKQPDPNHHTNLFMFYMLSARMFLDGAMEQQNSVGLST